MNKNSKTSAVISPRSFPYVPVGIGMFLFILAAGAGLLALSSCSTSPEGIVREEAVIHTISNVVDHVRQYAPLVPAPANSFVEPLLALCSAALAIWSGYLHRNVRILVKAANGTLAAPGPAPPTAADLAARLAATKAPGT